MFIERTERDLITARFQFRESYGYESEPPKPEYTILFLKTILHVAGADEILSKPKRNWVPGFASVCGKKYLSANIKVACLFLEILRFSTVYY